ncbi:MAG TPA: DUF1697 domain-containing protein [Cyclobacteriaceae bacterium]|nr:DUF1697 domain-containing protein [Cyclobacteriaceae bacterium]
MNTYIALLRGINITGYKIIRMDDLRKIFESMKFRDVKNYIQSGNMVFRDPEKDAGSLVGKIEARLKKELGYEVKVIVRSPGEFKKIISGNPFLSDKQKDPGRMHVTFLSEKPGKDLIGAIHEIKYPPDEFYMAGKEIYVHCPDGYGKSKLNNTFFEKKLKTVATSRNWRTVNELFKIAMAKQIENRP